MGGTLSGPALTGILNGCTTKKAEETAATTAASNLQFLTAEQDKVVAEIAEIIIPTTKTPGAKAAKVNEFIDMMLAECYPEKDQKSFTDGLERLEKKSQQAYKKSFLEVSPEEKTALLKEMAVEAEKKPEPEPAKPIDDREGKTPQGAGQSGVAQSGAPKPTEKELEKPLPFFRIMKELTLLGYFSSEIGATQALAYDPVPGKYDGCTTMKEGQKAWATQ